MSSTAKAKLQHVFAVLDETFAKVHPQDVPELIKELRKDLSSRNSGTRREAYDKHSNAATNA
jgi:ABC-type lipopolysaccharide export system ATPase subunit